MSDTVVLRLQEEQIERLEKMEEMGVASSKSQAARRELGYEWRTPLRQVVKRVGDAFALTALFLVGATFFMPLEIRLWTLMPLIAAVVCYVGDRALKRAEPAVTDSLTFWRGDGA